MRPRQTLLIDICRICNKTRKLPCSGLCHNCYCNKYKKENRQKIKEQTKIRAKKYRLTHPIISICKICKKEFIKTFNILYCSDKCRIENETSKLKKPNDILILNKKKRAFLGLPIKVNAGSGGLAFTREIVRIRDNHTCQCCGKKWIEGMRRFDVHHLDEERESSRDCSWDREHMVRMITYCHKCHLNLDTVRRKMSFVRKTDFCTVGDNLHTPPARSSGRIKR